MLKRCSILLVAPLLAACGGATTFDQFSLEEGLSARMDASQRVVLVSNRGGKDHNRHVVCAEPSPDSIISASAILATKLERDSTDAETKVLGKASAEATFANAQNAAFVGMRTQTIQLLRDGLYRACEAYMNGAIDETEYNMLLVNMPKVMTALIAIDGLTARPAAPAVALAAPTITTTLDGTTTIQGGAAVTLDAAGKPISVTPVAAITSPAAMGGEKVSEAVASAVYGIAQTIQQTPTMPAICLSLLNDKYAAYRDDSGFRVVKKFCEKSLDTAVMPKMFTPPPMPEFKSTAKATPPKPGNAGGQTGIQMPANNGAKNNGAKNDNTAACPQAATCPSTTTTTTTVTK